MARSGKVWIDAELALAYGVTDIDGRQPPSYRRLLAAPPVYSTVIVD